MDDGYDRLIFPSIEREIRAMLTESASEQAIKMFEINLKPLLMQPPVKDKVTLGLDPAYRTGCKIAVVDGTGKVLDKTVVYPTPPQNKVEEAKKKLKELINKYDVDVISIGNGTASKESEIFVADLLKELEKEVNYMVVSEAGERLFCEPARGGRISRFRRFRTECGFHRAALAGSVGRTYQDRSEIHRRGAISARYG